MAWLKSAVLLIGLVVIVSAGPNTAVGQNTPRRRCTDDDECDVGMVCLHPGSSSTSKAKFCYNCSCVHGTCTAVSDNEASCVCDPGYEGSLCNQDINECEDSNICASSGGYCSNTAGSYTCACCDGFEGDGFTCAESMSYTPWTSWSNCQQTRRRTLASVEGCAVYERQEIVSKACGVDCAPRSCLDVGSTDGIYILYNMNNEPYTVFCDFEGDSGYMYIAPTNGASPSLEDTYLVQDHVVIRHLATDGSQKVARIEQITAYNTLPLSVQYDASIGYNPVMNNGMGPYLYAGLVPTGNPGDYNQVEQGYTASGTEYKFTNCDGNANAYFAFFFNHNGASATNPGSSTNTLMSAWKNEATAASTYIPPSFFSSFEIHMGGCGGLVTSAQFSTVEGAALGLRFEPLS